MQAFVNDRYGSPDVLHLAEVPKPEAVDDRVLVRVRAASVNAYDWHMLRGKPYFARLSEGLRRPKSPMQGVDAAGIVEAVGPAVTSLRVGDAVFGSRLGSFAEYVSGRNFVPMPAGLTFEEAAAIPTAAMTALQGLRDHGHLTAGEHVAILGAGGGVGHFAVQIAKALGASVTAVTSARHVDMVRLLGAETVVDYTTNDFARSGSRFDLILDVGGTRRLLDLRRALKGDGRLVMVAPQPGQWVGPIARILGAAVLSRRGPQTLKTFLASVNRDDLAFLSQLVEAGKLRPIIDRTFPFEQLPDAVRLLESGTVGGKVVVTVSTEG